MKYLCSNTFPLGFLTNESYICWYWCSPLGQLSAVFIVQPMVTCEVFLGGQRCQREPKHPHRAVQPDRTFLPSARDLHRGAAYYPYDRDNSGNNGGGTDHYRDGDERSEAGSNK